MYRYNFISSIFQIKPSVTKMVHPIKKTININSLLSKNFYKNQYKTIDQNKNYTNLKKIENNKNIQFFKDKDAE